MNGEEGNPAEAGEPRTCLSAERLSAARPYEAMRDSFIVAIFPWFVLLFAAVAVVWFAVKGDMSFGVFLESLCWSYVMGFSVLGVPCVFLTRANVILGRYVALGILGVSAAIGAVVWLIFGEHVLGVSEFITKFFDGNLISGFWDFLRSAFNEDVSLITVTGGVLSFAAMVTLTTYGVLSVVVAYFRRNYHRILLSLEKPGESKLKRASTRVFRVPDIIDVHEVTIGPDADFRHFSRPVFRGVALYVMVGGLTIASYLFLNPAFNEAIEFGEMMTIVILLSLFVVVLVLPCSIVKRLNAKALSGAPRPYVLWIGMRQRLLQTYFIVFMLLTLFLISLFVDTDFAAVAAKYVGYALVMVLMSILIAFIYTNSFYIPFREGIVENFNTASAERREGRG